MSPQFAQTEFNGRAARVLERMRAAGVAFALFDEIEAMLWLTGYGNSENRWRRVGIGPGREPF